MGHAVLPNGPALDITFTLDGQTVVALPEETILQVAERYGKRIPHLCYKKGYRASGNCRACVVQIDEERSLAPSCCRFPAPGMSVLSDNERSRNARRIVLELLQSDMPAQSSSPYVRESELDFWVSWLALPPPRFPGRLQPQADPSHPAISVNLDACIQCARCVLACREEQVNDVIGMAWRGSHAQIVFDAAAPMGESSCVACGECVQACPTGALAPAQGVALEKPDRTVKSVCPYCGVGCLLNYHVKDQRILFVEGRDGPSNKGRLCVKGRYGFDYVHHPDRLTMPLLRKAGVAKSTALIDPARYHDYFSPVSWEQALDEAANRLRQIRDTQGGTALAGFGCAKGSNEEAYLFQKLVRTAFKSNNVDHCTRLCHASSVAALLEAIGSGAVSNQVADGSEAELIMVVGARPTDNHPVAATFLKNAVRRGSRLVLIEPYASDLAVHASHFLQLRPGTDVLLLSAMMYTLIQEQRCNEDFIRDHTENFAAFKERVLQYPPETVAPLCAIAAERIREIARLYAEASTAIIFWGMGISQHVHGTDNARCLIALALMTGHIGKPGTGLHPLRGQNNVQGASDVGLIPMFYPDYQSVAKTEVRQRFEQFWGTALHPSPGKTVIEVMHAIRQGELQGMYIMGENPAMSDPNLNHSRGALAMLDCLVMQDIFFTETCSYADVIFPASAFAEKTGTFTNTDRRVQMGRQAIPPPGQARQDLWIIHELAKRFDLDWCYSGPQEVFTEICQVMPSMAGMDWVRLEEQDTLSYPLYESGAAEEPVIFQGGVFPTASGRGRFVPVEYAGPDELPDTEYPWIFITGRQLEHWHTGTMTRRARVLDHIEPEPCVSVHPQDAKVLHLCHGALAILESRRGRITVPVRVDEHMQQGVVMMPFNFHEAAANLLTNDVLDPQAKIPEFKFCAVKLTPEQTPSVF